MGVHSRSIVRTELSELDKAAATKDVALPAIWLAVSFCLLAMVLAGCVKFAAASWATTTTLWVMSLVLAVFMFVVALPFTRQRQLQRQGSVVVLSAQDYTLYTKTVHEILAGEITEATRVQLMNRLFEAMLAMTIHDETITRAHQLQEAGWEERFKQAKLDKDQAWDVYQQHHIIHLSK